MCSEKGQRTRFGSVLMAEEWRDITGYEGLYQVSNFGRVRSLDRVVPYSGGVERKLKGTMLKACVDGKGYRVVRPHKDGKGKTFKVSILVAAAFIGPRPEKADVCHGPQGQQDDSVTNLRYDTHSNNALDRYRDGTMKIKPVRCSNGEEYRSIAEASQATEIGSAEIAKVCGGYVSPSGARYLTAGGFSWEFI